MKPPDGNGKKKPGGADRRTKFEVAEARRKRKLAEAARWKEVDAEVARLAACLRENKSLQKIVEKAAYDSPNLSRTWWDTLCGTLAGFPRMIANTPVDSDGAAETAESAADLRKRIARFIDTLDAFSAAALDFESSVDWTLPIVDGAVMAVALGEDPKSGVTLEQYLALIKQMLEEGSAGPWAHPLVRTPTGRAPESKQAAAAWCAIRALEMVGITEERRGFRRAAAECAGEIHGEIVGVELIGSMLKNRRDAHSGDAD